MIGWMYPGSGSSSRPSGSESYVDSQVSKRRQAAVDLLQLQRAELVATYGINDVLSKL